MNLYFIKHIIFLISLLFLILLRLNSYKKTKDKFTEISKLFFYTSLAILFCNTLIPNINFDGKNFNIIRQYGSGLNLIPFLVFKQTLFEVFKNNNISYFLINFLGNIIIFIPLGFFPPLLSAKIRFFKTTLLCFSVSFFIEFIQFFIGRGTDIDDLWINTLGGILGYIIYKTLNAILTNKKDVSN